MKRSLLAFAALLCCAVVFAQPTAEKDAGPVLAFETRMSCVELNARDGLKFAVGEFEALLGYDINRRFSVYVPLTETVGLFKRDDRKSYECATQLGLGAGCTAWRSERLRLEIVAKTGTTLGGDWRFVYYDAGLRLGFTNSLYVGIGLRYYDTYRGKGLFGNHCNYYAAFGGRLNFHRK